MGKQRTFSVHFMWICNSKQMCFKRPTFWPPLHLSFHIFVAAAVASATPLLFIRHLKCRNLDYEERGQFNCWLIEIRSDISSIDDVEGSNKFISLLLMLGTAISFTIWFSVKWIKSTANKLIPRSNEEWGVKEKGPTRWGSSMDGCTFKELKEVEEVGEVSFSKWNNTFHMFWCCCCRFYN